MIMMMIVIIIMIIMMIVKIIRLGLSDDIDELLGPIFDEEVPDPMTQEEIVQPNPTTQVEIVHEPKIIQQNPMTQVEIVYMQMICLPVAPKTRVFLHQHFGQVLPTTRYKTMWAPKYS